MPTIDSLWELFVKAASYLLCTMVDFLLGIVLVVFQHVSSLLPNIPVPSWLAASAPLAAGSGHLLAYFFPVAIFVWFAGIIAVVEGWYSVVVPLWRGIMDLF